MQDPLDFELQKPPGEPPTVTPGPPRRPTAWIVAAVAIAVAAAVAYFWSSPSGELTQPEEAAPVAEAPAAPTAPLGGEPVPIDVPPLDQTDPLVRRLAGELSSHPRLAAWLATDNLIRTVTVAVENVANGTSPATHVRVLRPAEPFLVIEDEGTARIDPRSYRRYDGIADAVASLDAAGLATLYATLKPRIEEAYRDLGHVDSFDRALERAIVTLLRTPVLEGDVPLVWKGALYGYADPRLERLNAAQRQFLRMGPRNVRTIQGKLRDIARELGIPDSSLPSPGA